MNIRFQNIPTSARRWALLLVLVLCGLQLVTPAASACVNPEPEGPPPIIFWCRPTPWGGCLPAPTNAPSGGNLLLGIGGYTTAATAAGDSCSSAVSPQGEILGEVRSLRLVHAETGEILNSFPFTAVPAERQFFAGEAFYGERWTEFRARVTEDVPAGIPVTLVFEVTARDGRRPPVPLVATAQTLTNGGFEHLAMTFTSDRSTCSAAGRLAGIFDELATPEGGSGDVTCHTFCCAVCSCCANGTGEECCGKCESACNTEAAP